MRGKESKSFCFSERSVYRFGWASLAQKTNTSLRVSTTTYYVLQSMRRKGRKEGSASRAEKRNKIIKTKTKDEDYLSDQQKRKQKNATSNIDWEVIKKKKKIKNRWTVQIKCLRTKAEWGKWLKTSLKKTEIEIHLSPRINVIPKTFSIVILTPVFVFLELYTVLGL